jgi:hypothetical protein
LHKVEGTARITRRRPGRWTLISGVTLIAVGVLSFNAYASFSATANYNQNVSSGYMQLTLANESSATINYNLTGSNLAPGDTMQRGMLMTFAGTISAGTPTVSAADAAPTALTDGTANGLTLTIQKCSQAWDETDVGGGIPTYACAGSTSSVLAATAVSALIASPANLSNLNTGGANHVKLTWTFPSAANNTFNVNGGLSDTITLTFSAPQRAATDK